MQTLKSDEGIALVVVMGVVAIASILMFGAATMAIQSQKDSVKTLSDSQSFQSANAAIDLVLADFQQNGYDSVKARCPLTGTLSNGATYSSTVTPTANSEYEAIATGTYRGVSEQIKVKFFYLNLWEMVLAGGSNNSLTAGGGGVNGTSNVTGPFYVRGTIEMGGTSYIHKGPLFVKDGDLILSGNAKVGEPGHPIYLYVNGAVPTSNVYAISVSKSCPVVTLPTVDMAYMNSMASLAKSESFDNMLGYPSSGTANLESIAGNSNTYTTMQPPSSGVWTRAKAAGSSSCYKYIGPESGISALGAGSTNLTIGPTSFGSWDGDTHYSLMGSHDDFAFDSVNKILYVEGTVFIDGDLTFTGNIRYQGNGTIVVNGDITINGTFNPVTELNPSEAVGLVTPDNIFCHTAGGGNAKLATDPADVSGAFFAGRKMEFDNNILVKGSVIAANIVFGHPNVHLVTNPLLPAFLPQSMPGRGSSILSKGAWTRM